MVLASVVVGPAVWFFKLKILICSNKSFTKNFKELTGELAPSVVLSSGVLGSSLEIGGSVGSLVTGPSVVDYIYLK